MMPDSINQQQNVVWALLLTVDRDGSQDDPGRPLGQVLDEHQGHEGRDGNEVGLLQLPLPVYAIIPTAPKFQMIMATVG